VTGSLPTLRVQVVLYRQTVRDVWALVPAVAASASQATEQGYVGAVSLALGDCSPRPILSPADISEVEKVAVSGGLSALSYEFFNANLGSSGGSNRLAGDAADDYLLILNPDTYPSPQMTARMLAMFHDPSVGAVDARQIPLEHPKFFDALTGDTGWLSGSCLMVRNDVYRAIGGFDDRHFFLYCDDVDLSWRIRIHGLRTVHAASAVVFHDKRIELNGSVKPTELESYYGALGRLALAYKYGRQDIARETMHYLRLDGDDGQKAAAEEWDRRVAAGEVPEPVPRAGAVAEFVGGEYARHRF
jgi:hypothetical protein